MKGSSSFRAKLFHPVAPYQATYIWCLEPVYPCVVQLILHVSTGDEDFKHFPLANLMRLLKRVG